MKKVFAVLLSALFLLPSCRGRLYSADGLSYGQNESVPAEQLTEFWKTFEPFSYHQSNESENASVEQVISVEDGPLIARSANPGFLTLTLNGLPYQYDEETGGLICLHNDPLCLHGSGECPFSDCTGDFREHDGKIYFSAMVLDPLKQLGKSDCVWDPKAMTVKTLRFRDFGVMCMTAVYDGGYRYVYDIAYRENDGGEIWKLIRQNLNSGRMDVLEETEGQPPLLLCVRGDIFLWFQSEYDTLYVSDRKNPTERTAVVKGMREGCVFEDESGIWFPMKEGDVSGIGSYCPADASTSFLPLPGWTDSAFYAQSWYMTERFVYYLAGSERTVSVRQRDDRSVDIAISPADIVRVDRESGAAQTILRLEGDLSGVSASNFLVSGDYLYIPLDFIEDETRYGMAGNIVLRIGLSDGSRYAISAPDLYE